jgi:hypothetical protein
MGVRLGRRFADDDDELLDEGEGGGEFDELLRLLDDFGVPLPSSTSEDNFVQHLTVALTALNARKGGGGDEDEDEGLDMEGAQREGPTGGMMMSLSRRLRRPSRARCRQAAEEIWRNAKIG